MCDMWMHPCTTFQHVMSSTRLVAPKQTSDYMLDLSNPEDLFLARVACQVEDCLQVLQRENQEDKATIDYNYSPMPDFLVSSSRLWQKTVAPPIACAGGLSDLVCEVTSCVHGDKM